ncbi:ferredoxin [Yoonia sp. MH D7]
MAIDLKGTGLALLGQCPLEERDGLSHHGGSLILLGPDEPQFWPVFTQSAEYNDDQPDPMDRWSRRIIDGLAARSNGTAYYPFGGAPFHPFYTWALRSGRAWASPIGFLVHDVAGLFVSYRGTIWVPQTCAITARDMPCNTCAAPCKTACPVDALADGYDVATCKTYIGENTACVTTGCAARRACPVGAHRRLPAQSAFHMEAFL